MRYIQYPDHLDLLGLHQHHTALFPALLQSSNNEGWDILFALPQETRLFAQHEGADFLQALSQIPVSGHGSRHAATEVPLPFYGGWCVYAGYELLHSIEPTVPGRHDTSDFPLAALIRAPAAVLYHQPTQTTWLAAENAEWLKELQQNIFPCEAIAKSLNVTALTEEPGAIFLAGVMRCKQYVREGDVFQVNLSRAWDATLAMHNSAVDVYARLRQVNPAPFSACVDLGSAQIISSSPERLVRVKDDRIESRPIAGTHPRARDPLADAALKARLIESVKERAEHIMLVDLGRNDLGRLCRPGSVEVNELMALTSYTHVHHIESNIRGHLRANLTAEDIMRALFPGGTITGCPKVRTMQIIQELESRPRLAYTGSVGYINQNGALDLNILIRSFIKQGPHLYFRAGAGIVADSEPERELQETRAKAKGLLRALGAVD